MPISDFQENVKKMSSDVLLATNQGAEGMIALTASNFFKKTIQIDNSTKSAKTNYIISFVLDHLSLWRDDKSAFNFCDLRIYDSDGTTQLMHEVQGSCTQFCLIFVKIPQILANSSKNIYMEYGNVALPDVAVNPKTMWGAILDNTLPSLLLHMRANTPDNTFNYHLLNDDPVQYWQNTNFNGKVQTQFNPALSPIFKTNQINGLPVLRFNGISQYLYPTTVETDINGGSEFSIFAVAKASSITNYQSIVRFQNAGSSTYVVFPFNNGKVISSNDGGIAGGVNLNPNLNSFNLLNCNYKTNTIFETYKNGSIVATRAAINATIASQRLGIGSLSNGGGEYFNGDLAEVLIYNKALNLSERQQVENYLNIKYRIYNTSDMPIITIESEQTIAFTSYNYISYAPVSSWSSTSQLSANIFGIQETSAKIKIQNIFKKTIVAGVDAEGWTNSNQYYNNFNTYSNILLTFCRARTISAGTTTPDTVNIQAINLSNSINLNSLDNFNIYNELTNSYISYISDDSDYISLDFETQNASNINYNTSYLEFTNLANSLNFKSFINNNETVIENSISSKIRIKKSNFIKTGIGNWGDITNFKCLFKTVSNTQNIFYGNLELIENSENKKIYKKGEKLQLATAVSLDNGSTYYNQLIHNGIIQNSYADNDIAINAIDFLDEIKKLKMSELPAFTSNAVTFASGVELEVYSPYHKRYFFSYFIKKLLTFAIPAKYLDVNCDFIVEDEETAVLALNYFNINENQILGDILEDVLKACGGIIYFNSTLNKYFVRNFYNYGDYTVHGISGNLLPSPYIIPSTNILEYSSDSRDSNILINSIDINTIADNFYKQNKISSNDGLSILIKDFATTSIYLNKNTENDVVFCSNLVVTSFSASDNPTSDIFDNSGLSITSISYLEGTILIKIKNTGNQKYLRKIVIEGSMIDYFPVQNTNQAVDSVIIKDLNSIIQYGKQSYVISNKYQYIYVNSLFNTEGARIYASLINCFKDEKKISEIKLTFNPNLYLGQIIKIKNKNGKIPISKIISIDQDSSPPIFTTTIKIIELI
jgi:hypothetical protein